MDLQRLEDLISEIATKVRSLARQKGKAQRFMEFRQRRLDVEVTVVRFQLRTLTERLNAVDLELQGDKLTGEGMIAELRTAEAEFESLRLREVDAEKARAAAAQALDRVREQGRLAAQEKPKGVACPSLRARFRAGRDRHHRRDVYRPRRRRDS